MAPSAALTSDHVNYLIFRYLQEAGHENTATAFYRDWHRTAEYRDPENYPFAPVVRRNELVHIIQSGLQHDELEARVRKDQTRFRLTRVDSADARGELENGAASAPSAAGSRPGSSAKRKGRAAAVRAQDDFPTPAPKRLRRSEERQINGDTMDVDTTVSAPAGSPAADADDDGEAVSPAVVSEPEMVEVHERYDSMDVAVQTETKTGPKTSTMYWQVEKPKATIYHSVFNPSLLPPTSPLGRPHTLMTVGELLCRFYQVPENMETTSQVLSIDEPTLPRNSVVTASAWHPNGQIAAFAADTLRDLSDGTQASQQLIFSHDSDTGKHLQYTSPPLLEPQGIVLALRYNGPGDRLLVLRTNLKHGLVLVYNTAEEADHTRPIAWIICEQQILDAAWVTPSDFVFVGESGLSQIAHVEEQKEAETNDSLTPTEIKSYGITQTELDLTESDRSRNYDKVRVGPARSSFAPILIASSEEKKLTVTQAGTATPISVKFPPAIELPGQLTAVAFQAATEATNEEDAVLVALTFQDGTCTLYSYSAALPDEIDTPSQDHFQEVLTLRLKHGRALALAWSPDGGYLAVAGTNLVQIWEASSLVRREGRKLEKSNDASQSALVTWRPDTSALGERRNGEHEDSTALSEPSLSWSANGKSLAFAVDREVAVIRFTPPLGTTEAKEGMNGHVSP